MAWSNSCLTVLQNRVEFQRVTYENFTNFQIATSTKRWWTFEFLIFTRKNVLSHLPRNAPRKLMVSACEIQTSNDNAANTWECRVYLNIAETAARRAPRSAHAALLGNTTYVRRLCDTVAVIRMCKIYCEIILDWKIPLRNRIKNRTGKIKTYTHTYQNHIRITLR